MGGVAAAANRSDAVSGVPNRFCPGAIGQFENHQHYSLLDPSNWKHHVRPKPPRVGSHGPPHPYITYPDIPATHNAPTPDGPVPSSPQKWRTTRTRLHPDHRMKIVFDG